MATRTSSPGNFSWSGDWSVSPNNSNLSQFKTNIDWDWDNRESCVSEKVSDHDSLKNNVRNTYYSSVWGTACGYLGCPVCGGHGARCDSHNNDHVA